MLKRKRNRFLCLCVIAGLLSGCTNAIPELTTEQTEQISEYASAVLLSHDEDYQSRLLNDEEIAEAQAAEARKEAAREAIQKEEEEKAAQEEQEAAESQKDTEAEAVAEPIAVFLEMEGVEITYQGFELADFYPGQAEVTADSAIDISQAGQDLNPFFSMSAAQGNKLVVLKFQIRNLTGEDKTVDVLSKQVNFRVTYNDGVKENVLTTMLTDDLSTFQAVVSANGAKEAVLVSEMSETEAGEIGNIALTIRYQEETQTISLQ